MTDYKAIADRLVERGIGKKKQGLYQRCGMVPTWVSAEIFLNSWDVAGACMERMCESGSIPFLGRHTTDTYQCTYRKGWGHNTDLFHSVNKSLPLAIILAYLEATDET